MDICISRNIAGCDHHLLITDEGFSWIDKIPDNIWTLGNSNIVMSIDEISRALGKDLILNPGEKWTKVWNQLSPSNEIPMWSKLLPENAYKKYLSEIIDASRMILKNIDDTYFSKEFLIGRKLILGLKRARINEIRFHSILSSASDQQNGSISAFKPDSSGFAKIPKYDQTGSSTGRLTIKNGPNILTLKKEYRNIITSRYNNGQILNVDFVSLEPRILYGINNGTPPDDIYESISNKI